MGIDKLRFGTAGIPVGSDGDTLQGIKDVRKLGLDCMELEFVRSIYLKKEKTGEIRKVAKENDILLSCHAPYWINLNSDDKKKFYSSIGYIRDSARISSLCGGFSVCFHAGFYQKETPEKVYGKIKEAIKKIVKEVREFDKNIWIRPEISGKKSQFGNLNEVIKLSKEIEQVMPCIDFSHFFARNVGAYNTEGEFKKILEIIEKNLGKIALSNMHIHVSGIDYGEKGERNHINLKESEFNYKDLIKTLKEFNVKGIVISESPNIEGDALFMKQYYEGLK